MKRRTLPAALLLLCGLCFGLLCPCAAAESTRRGQNVRVGFFAFDGYHMRAADGSLSGYGYDFLQEMGRYEDWTYTYVGYDKSWSEMQDMLANGEIDMLTSAQKTPEREARFAFSERSIGTSAAILTVRSGDTRRVAGSYTSYDGMRIGLLKNNSRNEKLVAFAAEKGFSYTPVYYDSVSAMTADLQAAQNIDAIFTSNLRSVKNEWILDQFDPSDFYVMVRRDDTSLLAQVNAAIDQMDASMPYWRAALWNRYYTADSGSEIAFSAAERNYILNMKRHGTVIRALVEPDRMPYSGFENGKAVGIIPELFAKISDMTGLSFEIVETADRQSYFEAVKADNGIDVRVDAYADNYDAERAGYKLTAPYLTAFVSVVTRRGTTGEPKTVAMVKDADPTGYRAALLDKSGVSILQLDSLTACLDAVKAGRADAAYVLSYTAQSYLNEHDPTGKLKATLLPQYSVSYAVGVDNGADIRLLTILDKAVNNLKSSDRENIILAQTARGDGGAQTLYEFFERNPFVLTGLCLFAVVIAALALLLVYRQKNITLIEGKNRELREQAARADRANAAKSDFLSRMSHDMRTPLNGIIGMTRLTQELELPEKARDNLEKIDTSSKFMLSLINDVLDMSRAESSAIELHCEPYYADDFEGYIGAVIRPLCESKNQTLSFAVTPLENVVPLMDILRVNQVYFNLLSNAVKYTQEGGEINVTVREELTPADRDRVSVTIRDNGIGMSEEFQKQLFEPFTQENRDDSSEMRGSGLGLAIVKRDIDAMGGTIRVESEIGRGTAFYFTIDCDYLSAPNKAPAKAEPAPADDAALRGRHVLLCEDHPLNQEIASALLGEKGMLVEIAENGQQGLARFCRSPVGFYDVVLMDIRMPVMNGYEATAAIRALDRPDAACVPIIAMTADAFADDVQSCLDAGMSGHVAKPVDPALLYESIRRVLGGDGAEKQ